MPFNFRLECKQTANDDVTIQLPVHQLELNADAAPRGSSQIGTLHQENSHDDPRLSATEPPQSKVNSHSPSNTTTTPSPQQCKEGHGTDDSGTASTLGGKNCEYGEYEYVASLPLCPGCAPECVDSAATYGPTVEKRKVEPDERVKLKQREIVWEWMMVWGGV